MVHDSTPSDNWLHDTDSALSHIYDSLFTENYSKYDLQRVENGESDLKSKFKEALIFDEYNLSAGIITLDERADTLVWYETGISMINTLVKNYHVLRHGFKTLPPEEYDILYLNTYQLILRIRTIIKDRNVFDREVERRTS